MKTLLVVAVLLLAGCAAPRILGADENGVIVAMGGGSEQDTAAVAGQHCSRFGRIAKPAATSANSPSSSPAILFDCVTP